MDGCRWRGERDERVLDTARGGGNHGRQWRTRTVDPLILAILLVVNLLLMVALVAAIVGLFRPVDSGEA